MQKINLEKIQEGIDSRSLTGLGQSTQSENLRDKLKRSRLMDRLWEKLQEIYGHQLNSQFGETMPEGWERLLTGITRNQIASGLNNLASRVEDWPPNAVEFRQLCLPQSLAPNDKKGRGNHVAYLGFNDPKHPSNDPASPEYNPKTKLLGGSKKGQAGRETLSNLKDLLK